MEDGEDIMELDNRVALRHSVFYSQHFVVIITAVNDRLQTCVYANVNN